MKGSYAISVLVLFLNAAITTPSPVINFLNDSSIFSELTDGAIDEFEARVLNNINKNGVSRPSASGTVTTSQGHCNRTEYNADSRPPNIIFILADDMGWGDLKAYGHPYAKTPNIDQLATDGVMFKRFYVGGATCSPSRTAFMTSRYPAELPNFMAVHGLNGLPTVTSLLKECTNYTTGHFGKWHVGPDVTDGTYGLDEIEVIKADRKDARGRDSPIFDAAIDFIRKNKDKPMYLNIWGHITHTPIVPPRHLVNKFKTLKVNYADFGKHMTKKMKAAEKDRNDIDQAMRVYLADILSLDDQVGRLLDELQNLGLSDNTLIAFTSDQGPSPVKDDFRDAVGYTGGLKGGKHTFYDGGVRVPFILRWPAGIPAGQVNEKSVVSSNDWLPLVCKLANVRINPNMFLGQDISDIVAGSERFRNEPLFWSFSTPGSDIAMLYENYKVHFNKSPKAGSGRVVELYDVVSNPQEDENLAMKRPELAQSMLNELLDWNGHLPDAYSHDPKKTYPFNPNRPPYKGKGRPKKKKKKLTPMPMSNPTSIPTSNPTSNPTPIPTLTPMATTKPMATPSPEPTLELTVTPTAVPKFDPSPVPEQQPTMKPTKERRKKRTAAPTSQPTPNPTRKPSPGPTQNPTPKPTREPTSKPTRKPTRKPTPMPTRPISLYSQGFERSESYTAALARIKKPDVPSGARGKHVGEITIHKSFVGVVAMESNVRIRVFADDVLTLNAWVGVDPKSKGKLEFRIVLTLDNSDGQFLFGKTMLLDDAMNKKKLVQYRTQVRIPPGSPPSTVVHAIRLQARNQNRKINDSEQKVYVDDVKILRFPSS